MTLELAPASPSIMTYDEAVMYCFFCNHNGHRDWRLPTHEEYNYEEYIDNNRMTSVLWCSDGPPRYFSKYFVVPVRTKHDS